MTDTLATTAAPTATGAFVVDDAAQRVLDAAAGARPQPRRRDRGPARGAGRGDRRRTGRPRARHRGPARVVVRRDLPRVGRSLSRRPGRGGRTAAGPARRDQPAGVRRQHGALPAAQGDAGRRRAGRPGRQRLAGEGGRVLPAARDDDAHEPRAHRPTGDGVRADPRGPRRPAGAGSDGGRPGRAAHGGAHPARPPDRFRARAVRRPDHRRLPVPAPGLRARLGARDRTGDSRGRLVGAPPRAGDPAVRGAAGREPDRAPRDRGRPAGAAAPAPAARPAHRGA